jgi:PadR family transcriptional regulator PadR
VMTVDFLSRAEEILLLAILRLGDEAYGVSIAKEIGRRTGKVMKLGALWVSLDIAHQKGLVSKRTGDPTPQRGGTAQDLLPPDPRGLRGPGERQGAQPGPVAGPLRIPEGPVLR